MRTRAHAADPAALDVPYIAEAFVVPEAEVQALLDAPTVELIQTFLASVTSKAHDYDDLKAEKLRVDVELENSVRTSETKAKAQKAQLTKNVKEAEELRTKLQDANAAREALNAELESLRTSTSGSTAETQALKQRIDSLEASNRDALALVENTNTEKDRLATELSEQHAKILTLRREVSALEDQKQSLENATSSQKFKEQSLQQEIDLLKKNNEWQSSEMQTRQQDYSKFRKERNARIATLQRELEDANASVETLKRTEGTLRQRLEEMQSKADEAFSRLAAVQEEHTRKEQDLRTEIDSTKRLAELQAQNAATHKARLQEVQGQLSQSKEDAADEIGRLQAEIETERSDREGVERKFAELEVKYEQLEQNRVVASRPGTPMRNGGLESGSPGRFGSYAGSPIPGSARKVVGGLSFTQLYSKYTETQAELESEKRRTHKLSTAMDEMISELEGRQPEILELRNEHERLEAEVLDFSRLLDESTAHRESAVKDAQRWQADANAAAKESEILRQQLRDHSAQIKILLVELQSRDEGMEEMSAQERLELERAARGEVDDAELDGMSSTGRLISQRLVLFRDIAALQERNEELLRLTRALGEQMEGEEAREKARQSAADHEEVEVLRSQVERYKDELRATAMQIDSYMKERDMFRRMLRHRGQLAPDADLQSMFGQSVGPPATPMRNGHIEPATPRSKDVEDLNKLLKEQQAFFDQYRTESSDDRRRLKDQVDSLSRERGNLQAEVARIQSQLQLAGERHDMLQQNYAALRSENQELQKRSREVYEQLTRQEMKTNQAAEDLVEARSLQESLRSENANSKAEKELYKRIEARLTEDNQALMEERSRLNKLNTDLQSLQNERELTESETRRKQNLRVEALEKELSEAKRKAESSEEEYKRLSQRREFDESERRKREDDLTKALSNAREELVAARTTRDQLQARVDEMKIEVRAAEEKFAALQQHPAPRSEALEQGDTEQAEDMTPEQRLSLEISELRRDLDLARNALEQARQEVEQYKQIAQSSEEELASYNETSEQYKEETDHLIEEKDHKLRELEAKIEDLTNELNTTNSELSELRTEHEDASRVLEEQKTGFEQQLSRLQDDADRYTEEKKLIQEDLKAQAEIAQQAQQSYENELVKHGEAAKNLQALRKEYHDLRAEIANFKAEADGAKASLERGEESWVEQKERYERELEDASRRRVDLDEQNRLLHQQMDTFSSELKTLRQGRVLPATVETSEVGQDAVPGSPSTPGDGNLQEVIRYLRREKEILDVQHELAVQESRRLQQQLDYSNGQLEDVRQKLIEERRQSTDRLASEGSTSKLMEEIRQLNLYRESNEQLRHNLRQTEEKLAASRSETEKLLAEIDPLKSRIGELESDLEAKEGNMKLLESDRDHWRERTQNIISKYDRVDPAELEDLRKRIADLQSEKEGLVNDKAAMEAASEPLKQQIKEVEEQLQQAKDDASKADGLFKERLDKFKDQAKQQNRKQNDRITEANNSAEEARAEISRLSQELENTQLELEQARAALAEAAQSITEPVVQPPREQSAEEGEVENEDKSELQSMANEADKRANEQTERANRLQAEVERLEGQVAELGSKIDQLQSAPPPTTSVPDTMDQDQAQAQPEITNETAETLEKLRQELLDAQKEVESLRTNATLQPDEQKANSATQEDRPVAEQVAAQVEAQVTEQVAEQVAKQVASMREDLEKQHELARKMLEDQLQTRTNTMKDKLNQKLREDREKIRSELITQHSQELQNLRDEHAAALEKLKADHAAEVARLMETGAAAIHKAEEAAAGDAEAMSPVKVERAAPAGFDLSKLDISSINVSPAQAKEFVQKNATIRTIVQNNITKRTDQLKAEIAEKDAEITRLQAAQTEVVTNQAGPESGDTDELSKQINSLKAERDELNSTLESAKAAKASAENKVTQTEMKFKLLTNTRDRANAKLEVVKKAASETPEKPVKEVWEVAEKAQPKPAAATPAKPMAPSPALAAVQPPASPIPAGQPSDALSSAGGQPPAVGEDNTKMQERAQRFGGPGPSPVTNNITPFAPGPPGISSFGRPSQPSLPASPNPQAPVFTPGVAQPGGQSGLPRGSIPGAGAGQPPQRSMSQTGIPQPGGSRLPTVRGGGQAGRGASGQAGRGGMQSNMPRGGNAASQVGRGGRGGARGGANAGQKRQHEGTHDGDNKRTRGGGAGGA